MPALVVLPDDYSYVIAVAAASTTVNIFHFFLTARRRKEAAVPYPNAYASAEEAAKSPQKHAFNCAQRAHQNFLESYPSFLISLGVAGLAYPQVAAGLGASWIVARFMYGWGYARMGKQYSENGRGRLIGAWGSAPLLALTGTAIYAGVNMAL